MRAAAYMKKTRIQVLHAYGFYANCFAIPAARVAAVPAIVGSIRDIRTTWTPNQRRVERWACKLAHSVVTNAEAAKASLLDEGYDSTKIMVIPNGIDFERFCSPARQSTVRADFGIPADARLVGVVARIDECRSGAARRCIAFLGPAETRASSTAWMLAKPAEFARMGSPTQRSIRLTGVSIVVLPWTVVGARVDACEDRLPRP